MKECNMVNKISQKAFWGSAKGYLKNNKKINQGDETVIRNQLRKATEQQMHCISKGTVRHKLFRVFLRIHSVGVIEYSAQNAGKVSCLS